MKTFARRECGTCRNALCAHMRLAASWIESCAENETSLVERQKWFLKTLSMNDLHAVVFVVEDLGPS